MRAANVGIYLRLYKRLTVFSWQALKILATFAVHLFFESEKYWKSVVGKQKFRNIRNQMTQCLGGGIGRPVCRQAGLSTLPDGRHATGRRAGWNIKSMVWVYAISSLSRNYIYVGVTNDIDARFARHNSGREKTTKPYAPFQLLYTEACANRVVARKREKYWKSVVGKQKLRNIRNQMT